MDSKKGLEWYRLHYCYCIVKWQYRKIQNQLYLWSISVCELN